MTLTKTGFCLNLIFVMGLGSILPSPAAAATFSFRISDAGRSGNEIVDGLIFGLPINGVDQPAFQVKVTASSGGFGLGTYIGDPLINKFTTAEGKIVNASFTSLGALNSFPNVTDSSLGFDNYRGSVVGAFENSSVNLDYSFSRPVEFKLLDETPAAIPTPSLLLGPIGLGLAAIKRRRLW